MRELELTELKRLVDAALEKHGGMKVNIETSWQLFTNIDSCVDKHVDGKVFVIKGLLDEELIKKH